MSLNTITIMGRLCADPDYRLTQSQKAVTSFTLAVDRDFVVSGEKREADFIPVVCWGKTAEFAHSYFAKGSPAAVTGRLQMRSYTDRDGNKRTIAEVVADHLYFAGKKDAAQEKQEEPNGFTEIKDDGDLPF